MPRESEQGQPVRRHSFGWASLWRRAKREGKDGSGRRDSQEDKWTWFGGEPTGDRKQARLRPFLLIAEGVAAVAVISAGALFIVLRTGDAGGPDNGPAVESPGSTMAVTPSPELTGSPSATPAIAPVAFELAVWDSPRHLWETDDLVIERPASDNGLSVPFLLRMENATPGEDYRIDLTYGCGAGETSGLEFLTNYDRDAGSEPALIAPGPERPLPDATAVIGDDRSIAGDDEHGDRRFQLWGASFAASPEGPVPPDVPCEGDKMVTVSVRAVGETVHMLWGAALAAPSGVDGAGEGRFGMKVAVAGAPQEPVQINVVAPG